MIQCNIPLWTFYVIPLMHDQRGRGRPRTKPRSEPTEDIVVTEEESGQGNYAMDEEVVIKPSGRRVRSDVILCFIALFLTLLP